MDISVADALMAAVSQQKGKPPADVCQKSMVKAVSHWFKNIGFDRLNLPPAPPADATWITINDLLDIPAVAAAATPQAAKENGTKAAVNLLQFDEKSGQLLNEQVSFEQAVHKAAPIEVDWKTWLNGSRDMATTIADKSAVIAMLETVHNRWDGSAANVKIMLLAKSVSLVAGAAIKKNSLMLPCCIPKSNKVFDNDHESPLAVPVSVEVTQSNDDASSKPIRKVEFLVLPDFKPPTAVAAAPDGPECQLKWSKDESEVLHPFWAVRRLTTDQLQTETNHLLAQQKNSGEKQKIPKFNCEIVHRNHTYVAIGTAEGQKSLGSTRIIGVPFITNSKDLAEGEELIVKHVARVKTTKPKKGKRWQDVQREEEQEANKKKKPKK